jgi:hypothetical protein
VRWVTVAGKLRGVDSVTKARDKQPESFNALLLEFLRRST